MPATTDKKAVEWLLGTINYLAKLIPDMSFKTSQIWESLKKVVVFEWQAPQEKAFNEIKNTLSATLALALYDIKKSVVITCDQSKSGLEIALLQDNKPVAYASRSWSDAETRYTQIEKELSAVVFMSQKFHQHVYRKEALVESDHKPLKMILKKPLAAAPPHLQRMLLQLQKYTCELQFKPGSDMVLADTLSQAYIPCDWCDSTRLVPIMF